MIKAHPSRLAASHLPFPQDPDHAGRSNLDGVINDERATSCSPNIRLG
jgi:hypothetical protein